MEAIEPIHVDACRHGGQSTLTVEVAELLAELKERSCFGYPGQRLDHDVVETLAQITPEDAKEVLREFESRGSDGQSCQSVVALAEFIDALLEANDC